MEDFLGTLIYIIIAIAGIIVSIFNKKSKEEKVRQEYPEFDEEPVYRTSDNYFNKGVESIDDFFAQQFPGEETTSDEQEEEEEQEASETSEEEYATAKPATEDKEEPLRATSGETQLDSPGSVSRKRKHEQEVYENEPVNQIIRRFKNDPRQAVILSEILNRKEY